MANDTSLSPEHRHDVALGIILSVVTCGLYNIYWNYRQMKALNELLGKQEYDFVRWLLLSIVTCGIYHLYYEYRMGSDLQEILKARGLSTDSNLSLIGLLLSVFGLWVLADAIYQYHINRLVAAA